MNKRHKRGKGGGPKGAPVEVAIEDLGAQGDGVARHGGRMLYIPLTLPGDRVLARIGAARGDGFEARAEAIIAASPHRIDPGCPHYGECGGCALRHMAPDAYGDWKNGLAVTALNRAGIDRALLAPMIGVADGARRRAILTVKGRGRDFRMGFHGRRSHTIADVASCALLRPELNALLAPLRAILSGWPDLSRVTATLADNGIDLLIEGKESPDLPRREALVAFAEATDLARLSWVSGSAEARFVEPVATRRPPVIAFSGVPVTPPPGAFLQPSREGEAAIAALIRAAVGDRAPVADLYCGLGSFTFHLADGREILAVEGADDLIGALKAAADRAQVRNLKVETRDLSERPLLPADLKRFRAVVFDPPRGGATEQAEWLAEAGRQGVGPEIIVAVSCNPATFARDARALLGGGYVCRAVTPIDQFPHSGHLELVAVFGHTV